MIVVTGATGFIGSHLTKRLVSSGADVLGVKGTHGIKDELSLGCRELMPKSIFLPWLKGMRVGGFSPGDVEAVIHLGACTDTTCTDWKYLLANNTRYSAEIWNWCSVNNKKLIYASSAATYGAGERGFSDSHDEVRRLRPINRYGWSKQAFDVWALNNHAKDFRPPAWAGLKFFNVYGQNEAHKGKMASMVHQCLKQAREGKIYLFRPGDQKRDFVYVEDVVDVILHMLDGSPAGLFNLGTGAPRSFNVMAAAIFGSLGFRGAVEYFDIPPHIAKGYQDYTCADLDKLRAFGYSKPFRPIEQCVQLMT